MNKYLAELLGTFALVFFGTGAIIINEQQHGVISHVGIAICFGLIVMAMIYALGDISGAHLNPAVTLAFTLSGRFPVKQVPAYMASQIAGAILSSLVLKYLFPGNEFLGSTRRSGSIGQSFVLEMILTFLLMLVIIQVSTGSKERGMFAGLAIGSTVLLEALMAGPVSGASMNPARSLAPAIVSGHTQHLWIYLLAPVLGASFSIPVFKLLSNKKAV